jgi:hypothetical protein
MNNQRINCQPITKTAITQACLVVAGALATIGTFASVGEAASLGQYTFEPPPNPGSLNATDVASGLTFSTFSYVGTGTSNFPVGYAPGANPQNNGGKSYSSDQWSPTAPGAVPTTEPYWQFTITPNSGETYNLDSLSLGLQRNGNASPTNLLVRSSLDNYAATLGNFVLGSDAATRNIWQPFSTALGAPTFAGLAGPVTFRLYGYGEPDNLNGRQAENLDVDNIAVNGNIVPTPALLPGLLGLGVGAWRKRKQAKQAVV